MKKYCKSVLKVLAVIIAFVLLNQGAYWATSTPSFSHWSNHDLKLYKDKVDTAFFGTSHIYAGIDPEVFDAKTNTFCMNCGSGGQGMKQTYYYIDQMYRSCKNLKTVFVDLYFEDFQLKENNRGSELQDKMIIYSRMTNPLAKFNYVRDSFDINEYQYILFPALYTNAELEKIPGNIRNKLSAAYRNYDTEFSTFKDPYAGRGFIPFTQYDKENTERVHFEDHVRKTTEVDDEAFDYLLKIVDYCKEKNLRLIFVQMPFTTVANNDYEECIRFFDEKIDAVIEENNLTYYNINKSVNRAEINDYDYFADAEHPSKTGSDYFTRLIADYYNGLS